MPHELLKRFTYPVFPNETWKTVADVPIGAPVIDGGVLKQKLQYFNNDGVDLINCGKGNSVTNLLDEPTSVFCLELDVKLKSLYSSSGLLLSYGTGSDSILLLYGFNYSFFFHFHGPSAAIPISSVTEVAPLGSWLKILMFSDGVNHWFTINGIMSTVTTNGTKRVTPWDFVISAGFDGGSQTEGAYSKVKIFSDLTCQTKLDTYNFTNPALWDGGAAGVSEAGNAFTVTDGVPTTARQFDLIPVSAL